MTFLFKTHYKCSRDKALTATLVVNLINDAN